ncbi:arylamine N-acetyltransferase family protein [Microbulbifer hainanensis]|uniref:arylamine N-acetyltransferase family protein n=1 Tax=Microbulbifer hainanensis TaxID=2735675 RepID=UPI001867AE4C|nr:arylamine N-acetyltransferase [Microbulbifer hainanensis]
MTAVKFNLTDYLQRIDYRGRPSVDLDTLKSLITLHTEAIPFENLSPFLGQPVEIDLASVQRKLVKTRRGGYCYEQNALLRAALQAIGFPVSGLAARVLWQAPTDHQPAQSHMILRVEIEDAGYLVDVGFGGQTPTAPLRLDTSAEQATQHGLYRLSRVGDDYLLETRIARDWSPVYRFDLQEQLAGDYKVFNWYCSTHPESRFVNQLVAARAFSGGRHTLLNRELRYYPLNGPGTVVHLAGPQALRDTLVDVFRITLPEGPEMERALARLFPASEVRA